MNERVLYVILSFFLVLYAPYWIYLPALFLGIIIFPFFWESIFFSAFVDYYYGAHAYPGTPLAFPFAIAAALLVLLAVELKDRLRLNV